MSALLRTLSISYVRRHPGKALLAVLGIAIGVATFVSMKAAQETLAAGLERTAEQLSGRADLEVTGAAGIPEALPSRLEDVDSVDADQPVIEQVVQPIPSRLGGLLVLGIDLVGDTRMRDYQFDGDDADVDDPLVFLAQPDSIALTREFAARAGLRKGDVLEAQLNGRTVRFTVRSLLASKGLAQAYGGNVAVMDIYAAEEAFGRGRAFDRLDVRLGPGVSLDQGTAEILHAIGPGYRIETPERRAAGLRELANAFGPAFDVTGLLALAIGLFLIFNVCAVAVERRRRDVGILRALGATPSQVMVLFLSEATLLGVIGGLAGVALGRLVAGTPLRLMGALISATEGVSAGGGPSVSVALGERGLLLGVAAALVGAWIPARRAARIPPIHAMATGVYSLRRERSSPWLPVVGALLLGAAFLLGRFTTTTGRWLTPAVMVLGAFGAIVLAGRLARALISPLAPILAWLVPAPGRVATDAILGQPRRTAATAAILTVTAAFVLGTADYLQGLEASFNRWVANVVTADLVVRASPGLGASSVRIPSNLGATLLRVPGVAAADVFRQDRLEFDGRPVTLVALDARGFGTRTRHEFVAGDARAFSQALPDGQQCVVSDNLARRLALHVGDIVSLPSPTGPVRLPIAAVVVDFISTQGAIIIDWSLFVERWQSDRADAFYVSLSPGADPSGVRDALRARLGSLAPTLISTRSEYVQEMDAAIDPLYVLIHTTVLVAFLVAFMGVAASLLVSIAERSRTVGILRALGATPGQIVTAVALEAMLLAVVSLALAVPLGELLGWFLRARVSESLAGFHFPHVFPVAAVVELLLGLPATAMVATWMPARWAAGLAVPDAIAYE